MVNSKKQFTLALSILYVLIVLLILWLTLNKLKFPTILPSLKLLNCSLLIGLYLINTKKTDYLYILMIVVLAFGKMAYVFTETLFNYTYSAYFIAHIIFIFVVYRNFLKEKSIKNILLNSLPFLFLFTVFLFALNLTFVWKVKLFMIGTIVSINSSVVFISYLYKSNLKSKLLFSGMLFWFLTDAFTAIYMFGLHYEIFYMLPSLLDWISQFLICSAFISTTKDLKKDIV